MRSNKRNIFLYLLLGVLGLVVLPGCMVGPDYNRPEILGDYEVEFTNKPMDFPDANELMPVGNWWETFEDPYINELVDQVIANNNDLKVAASRVLESDAILARAFGRRLPEVDYNAGRRQGKVLPGSDSTKTYSQSLTVRWVADLFGKLRRAERAALNDLLVERANQRALVHSIISQTVRSRVEIATQQKLVVISKANIKSRQQTLNIVERRYGSGLVTSLDLYLARENYASAAATQPIVKQRLEIASHSLDVLLGRRPAAFGIAKNTLPDRPNLVAVPMSLPCALLDRRPDVRSAELQLIAATERVGVSIAELFPDLTLTGSGGYSSDSFRMSTATENQIYAGIISLAAPIYKGGQLREGVKASKARAEQAAGRYANTVLNAIREVEDALVKEKYLKETVKLQEERVENALKAESLARDKYARGVESLLVVLETERRRIISQNDLELSVRDLFNARIELYLALGGDWRVDYEKLEARN